MATILICTDGSELAEQAAREGLALLRPAEETVVVTVIEPLSLAVGAQMSGFAGSGLSADEVERTRREMLAEARDVVARAGELLGVDGIRTEVVEGDAGASVCAYAEQIGASAIVMGSRGRGGVKRALLGSVSDHVVRNAPCPVVIVNSTAND